MKKTELQTMVVNELKALAKKMNLKLPAEAKKSAIVEALSAAFRTKASRPAAGVRNSVEAPSALAKKSERTERNSTAKKGAAGKKPAEPRRIPVEKPAVETPAVPREWKVPPGTEEPLMAQERVADAKYYTGPGQDVSAENSVYAQLPRGYGEEKVALMVRDPYLAYVYWEVMAARLEREKAWFGWSGKLTIRLYDVTGVQFDGRNAIGYFDQEVDELIGNWYFDIGRPSHSFIADIGLLSAEGRFLTLARSNYIVMPQDGVSDLIDDEWMLADEEFWKLYGFPGGPSSAHLQEMMRGRRLPPITSPGIFSRPRRK